MPAFVAFFDAAGSQDDGKDAIFVSGFVSTVDRWERFDRSWRALLTEYHVTPPFHMSDFACGAGEYASWHRDVRRRQEFLTKAMDITLRNVLWSFSSGIMLADYHRVNVEYELAETQGEPFAMCAMSAMQRLVNWQLRRHIPLSRAVFEDGDNGRGDFIERFRAVAGQSPFMAKKGQFFALEAADMLAYEHAKLIRDVHSGRTKTIESIRVPFRRFEEDKRIDWGYHKESSLRSWWLTNTFRSGDLA